MPEDKLEIELDVNTKKAKDELDKLASRAAEIKVDIKVNKNSITSLENSLAKFKMIAGQDYLSSPIVKDGISRLQNLISQNTRYQSILRSIRSEQNRILKLDNIDVSGLQRANGILQKFGGAIYKVGNLVSKFGTNMRGSLVGSNFNWFLNSAGAVTSFGNAISNLGNKISNAKISMNDFNATSSRVSDSSQKISRNIFNASNYVDHFSRRIYGLLRNAFIFNVIRRGFKGLSDTLFNLIKRDTQFATTLLIVKANLIRAFAPIWQVVLPWIRALGRALVWLSNRLISFINYLAGREIIKPVKEIGEAQKVVSDFMKIASPKKEMFDLEKPAKKSKQLKDNTKKLKDNTKKAAKESNNLLASFDKLETLKFNKNGLAEDPFGLEELKDKNGNIKNLKLSNTDQDMDLKLDVDEEDIETQIARAINQIENPPLEFNVNDDIGSQITSQVNNLDLPTLDFKVDTDNKKLDEFKDKVEKIATALTTIGVALTTYKIVTKMKKFVDILSTSIAAGNFLGIPAGGWIGLIAGLLFLLIVYRKEITQFFKDLAPKTKEFMDKEQEKISKAWGQFWPDLSKGVGNFFDDVGREVDDFIYGINDSLAKIKIAPAISKLFEDVAKMKGISGHPGNIRFPGFAQGTVLKGGDPFLAYLNDQPRGQTNIEAPLSTMVSAFKQALSEGGYNGPTAINLEASGDMSELIRMLNIKISQERIRVGNSFVEGY